MYTYYTLSTLGFRPPWKILMTLMQITQFIGGVSIAHYIMLRHDQNYSSWQTFAFSLTNSYVFVVLVRIQLTLTHITLQTLFCQFFSKTYFTVKPRKEGNVGRVTREDSPPSQKLRRSPRRKAA